MSIQAIGVELFNKHMATLFYSDGKLCLQYAPEFLQTKLNPSPMNLGATPELIICENKGYNYGLPGLIADSLPDSYGEQALFNLLKSRNIDPETLTSLDRLSYVGNRGMGALSYRPDKAVHTIDINIKTIFDYAQGNIENRQKKEADASRIKAAQEIFELVGSIGGARPKAVIYRKGNSLISGLLANPPEGYKPEIIKISQLPGLDFGKIEHIYHLIAAKAGITAMRTETMTIDNYHHFFIERFDRGEEGKKLHTQTLAGLYGLDFHGYHPPLESIFAAITALTHDQNQVNEMFVRMLFNIIAVNHDDHAKNTSFIMNEKGEWKLSPVYDITYVCRPRSSWIVGGHSCTMNGKNDHFTLYDIEKTGETYGVKAPKLVLEKVITTFNEEFPKLCKEYNVTADKTKQITTKTKEYQDEMQIPKSLSPQKTIPKPKNGTGFSM